MTWFYYYLLYLFTLFFALKREEAHKLLQDLPDFEPSDNVEDNYGICLLSFADIIEDNKKAMNEELSRHAGPSSEVLETPFTGTGIVKLPDCGHIFCRKEYVSRSLTDTCVNVIDTELNKPV